MKEPVRVAVVGTGAISQIVHLPILREREDVELAVVADVDRHKAEALAERYEVGRVAEPDDVWSDDGVEAVFVCTPSHLHEEQVVAGLQGGKHVFAERPLALTRDGAARCVEVAGAGGCALVVGMSHRFRPDVAALRAFVAGGELGEPYAVRGAWLNRRVAHHRPTWRHDVAKGGGALVDLGVQTLDLCLWLVDYPRVHRVTAVASTGEHGVDDSAMLVAEAEGGLALGIEVSSRYHGAEDTHYARVMGTEGSGSLPPLSIFRQLGGRPMDVTPSPPRPSGGENPYMNAYRREIDHFVRVVRGEAEAPLPEEQPRLMALVEAARRSAREGREVEVEA